jgi:hypothetical protein
MKTKIGILTFHRSYNYGAFLQCYSLTNKIKEFFKNCEVEVIDYTTKSTFVNYRRDLLNWRRNIKNPKSFFQIQRRNRLLSGFPEKLPLSPVKIVDDKFDGLFEMIKERYDVVIVGSDAVWNWELRGLPNAYFLHGDLSVYKMSYAASLYGIDYQTLTEPQKGYLKECLQDFRFVGVRDEATMDMVKTISGREDGHHCCDPTVVLDLSTLEVDIEQLKRKMEKTGVDFTKPLIGMMAGEHIGREIRERYGDTHQIVAVYSPNKFAHVFLDDLNPFEWAVVFSMFQVTVTHFFHATIFSLKNLTPVICIEHENAYKRKYDTKICDLLKRLGLEEFYFHLDTDYSEVYSAIDKYCVAPPREKIKQALLKEAESYQAFEVELKKVVQSCERS